MIGLGAGQVAAHRDARVVDQDGDTGVGPQQSFDAKQVRLVVQVGRDDLDRAGGLFAETDGQRIEALSLAGDEDQIVPAAGHPIGVHRTDAGGSARDQGRALPIRVHTHPFLPLT